MHNFIRLELPFCFTNIVQGFDRSPRQRDHVNEQELSLETLDRLRKYDQGFAALWPGLLVRNKVNHCIQLITREQHMAELAR